LEKINKQIFFKADRESTKKQKTAAELKNFEMENY
jgi:hypothetical protein